MLFLFSCINFDILFKNDKFAPIKKGEDKSIFFIFLSFKIGIYVQTHSKGYSNDKKASQNFVIRSSSFPKTIRLF